MTESQLTLLIGKYLSGEASEEEKKQVEQWYESLDASAVSFADGNSEKINESTARSLKAIKEKIAQAEEKRPVQHQRRMLYQWRVAAAAAVLILISGTLYFVMDKKQVRHAPIATQRVKKDFKPGGNSALLTLANGKKIVLDSSNKGLLSRQGNTNVIKVGSGLLSYNRQSPIVNRQSPIRYNTITTPRGGRYEVVLPDGSKVWLNAASSIHFPTAFTGKKRIVEITGEAYFEVKTDKDHPFLVKLPSSSSGKDGGEIKVLGTHFNIMAYKNEPAIRTTLLEGSVKVLKEKEALLLKPGQQAVLESNGRMHMKTAVNINKIVAWKNRLFWFDEDGIQEVMKQLSRWYDVDIEIRGNIPDLFTGSIPQTLTFSKVFEILQKTGSIQYQLVNNRTIIVSPN